MRRIEGSISMSAQELAELRRMVILRGKYISRKISEDERREFDGLWDKWYGYDLVEILLDEIDRVKNIKGTKSDEKEISDLTTENDKLKCIADGVLNK